MLEGELGLEGSWHLWWWWAWESEGNLEVSFEFFHSLLSTYFHGVIDEPLESSEGSDHDDTWHKSLPDSSESELLEDSSSGGLRVLVELGDDGVGWVGDDGAEDSGDVSGDKGDNELLGLGALGSWLRHNVLVESLDGLLEAGELHHGVRDLSHPEWWESLVESSKSLGLVDEWSASAKSWWGSWSGLDTDLGGLHWGKKDIGEELGRSGGSQVQRGSVEVGIFLSKHIGVDVLEDLVESELSKSLEGISDEGRGPSLDESACTLLGDGGTESSSDSSVLLRVDLDSALDKIKWDDGGVGDSAGEDSSESAQSIVLSGSKLNGSS